MLLVDAGLVGVELAAACAALLDAAEEDEEGGEGDEAADGGDDGDLSRLGEVLPAALDAVRLLNLLEGGRLLFSLSADR